LVGEYDADALVREALAVLADPVAFRALGDAARARIDEQYSQDVCLTKLAEEFGSLALTLGAWR
jgi:hypothetical protein